MEQQMHSLVVTFDPGPPGRELIAARLGSRARAVYASELDSVERRAALAGASVILARNTDGDISDPELELIGGVRLIQLMTAGVDFIDLNRLPASAPTAANRGAYAEPMAEHALAMTLAASKRLAIEQAALAGGQFNQFIPNRLISEMTAGILGFGGIGVATARLMRAVGLRVNAINRRGVSDEAVDWIGTPDDLDALLAASDVLVLSLPLTRRSRAMIGARELGLMRSDAILVNLARGEIVDEDALFRHLQSRPDFTACIDAWWVEPVRHGQFRMDRPFLTLPNVIASPHNSASVRGWGLVALGRAIDNCVRALDGGTPAHLIGDDEREAVPA